MCWKYSSAGCCLQSSRPLYLGEPEVLDVFDALRARPSSRAEGDDHSQSRQSQPPTPQQRLVNAFTVRCTITPSDCVRLFSKPVIKIKMSPMCATLPSVWCDHLLGTLVPACSVFAVFYTPKSAMKFLVGVPYMCWRISKWNILSCSLGTRVIPSLLRLYCEQVYSHCIIPPILSCMLSRDL